MLSKQKQMLVREAEVLDALNYVDPLEKAFSIVFIGLDNKQLEEIFELEPGALLGFKGPILIDRPSL